MGGGRITVFLADDNVIVREGVRAILALEADLEVVGNADDAGLVSDATFPGLVVVGVALATLVAANLIAWFPARAAARSRPAVVLRSE